MSREVYSIVEDVGEYHSHCGYCKKDAEEETSVAHGMFAHTLQPQHYQVSAMMKMMLDCKTGAVSSLLLVS